jgi:hypothetical protein
MRRSWLLLANLLCACPSSGSGTSDDGGAASANDAGPDVYAVCDTFTKVGDPCGPAGATVCFKECDKGGCECKPTAAGGGVWTCTTDLSCVPEAGPLDDTGAPDDDAGVDASSDAPLG